MLRLLLVFMLLFAIFHVSQHDLDGGDGHLQDNCQICRLVHLHGAAAPVVAMFTPLLACLGALVVIATAFLSSERVYSWNSRAPPSI